MNKLNIYQDISKTAFSGLLCAGVLTASFSVQAADEILYPSQKPLSLTEGVPPTVLVTLDDSGSMVRDYAPDSIKNGHDNAMRSNAYNSMFYDPTVNYVVPKKYVYESGVIVGKDSYSTSYPHAKTNGFNSSSRTRNLTSDSYYYNYIVKSGCPASPIKNDGDCYTKVNINTSERQNFANWYSFYRTRQLATQSAAIRAFSTMPDNVRLTWGALNTCNIGTSKSTGNCNTNKLDRFAETHRANFFKWLETFPANDGTPLHAAMHRAAKVVQDDTDSAVCRANYHVLMTDGMWNGRNKAPSLNNTDSTAIAALPDGVSSYTSRAPYKDNQTNSLADVAFKYWATDLRTDLANKISPYMPIKSANPEKDYWDPRNNPATWQHMVNFTVGLGLSNALTSSSAPTWNGAAVSPTYNNIDELLAMDTAGKSWPTVSNDNNNNVYDLWHAAINSRGEFFSADSPDTLISAFEKILERISGRSTTGSSPTINSSVGDDGTGYSFQASYDADKNWSGDLVATKKVLGPVDGKITTSKLWSAQEKLDSINAARSTIKMANGSSLVNFQWSNLSAAQKTALNRNPDVNDNADTLGDLRVEFLRGDRSKEGTTFRKRSSVLGDIVGSKPVTVRGARYLTGLANRIEGADKKYDDFFTTYKTRKPMVYVGANDGMLHGFNADTGVEEFAFVPSAVFRNLHKLTATGYGEATHQFFVDGSPVVADVFINNAWRTVLVGTLAAGGKGMFALDVTDPNNITLLWEFNEDKLAANDFDVKLGYTFSQPTIARLHNGKWAAVVGNGYAAAGSENGKAALLIIDMATGALTKDLVVQGAAGVANGMSTPKLADINGDGIADYAYAGDLQGNVWRFDLAPNNGNPNNPFLRVGDPRGAEISFAGFQVSFGGSPLFSAIDGGGNRQPITAAPSIVRHPTGNGYIIVVGTGRFYADGDKNGLTDSTQSIYGVWDPTTKVARSAGKSGFPFSSVTRGQLHAQTMQAGTEAVVNGQDARVLSDTQVPWAKQSADGTWSTSAVPSGAGLKTGWYFDLVLSKEMIVADMLQFGQTLYFQTLLPNADPCAAGVENWSYAINPATGGRTKHHAWTDYRSTNNSDTVITAVKMPGEGGISIGTDSDGSSELCTGQECKKITPDSDIGRQTWRVVGGQ